MRVACAFPLRSGLPSGPRAAGDGGTVGNSRPGNKGGRGAPRGGARPRSPTRGADTRGAAPADAPPPQPHGSHMEAARRAHWRRPPEGRGRASRSANARRRGPPCDVTRCRAGRGAERRGGGGGRRARGLRGPLFPRGVSHAEAAGSPVLRSPPALCPCFPGLSPLLFLLVFILIDFIFCFFFLFLFFSPRFFFLPSFLFSPFFLLFVERVLRFLFHLTLQRGQRVPRPASPSRRHPPLAAHPPMAAIGPTQVTI